MLGYIVNLLIQNASEAFIAFPKAGVCLIINSPLPNWIFYVSPNLIVWPLRPGSLSCCH